MGGETKFSSVVVGVKVVSTEAFSVHQALSVLLEELFSSGGAVRVIAKLSAGKIRASEFSSSVNVGKIAGWVVGMTVMGFWTGRQWC